MLAEAIHIDGAILLLFLLILVFMFASFVAILVVGVVLVRRRDRTQAQNILLGVIVVLDVVLGLWASSWRPGAPSVGSSRSFRPLRTDSSNSSSGSGPETSPNRRVPGLSVT